MIAIKMIITTKALIAITTTKQCKYKISMTGTRHNISGSIDSKRHPKIKMRIMF